MLGESDDIEGLSEAAIVSYSTAAYHKRQLKCIRFNGLDIRVDLGCPQLVGPTIEEVCYSIYAFTALKY